MIELKYCPFCGAQHASAIQESPEIAGEGYTYCVECEVCLARGPKVLGDDHETQDEACERACERWNERP